MTRQTLAVVLLLFLAAATWYLARSLRQDDEEIQSSEILQSGFYLKSARILGTGDDGHLLFEIEAEYAEQQDNDEVELQNVEIQYTLDSRVPWILNADRAIVGEGREHVTLTGNVIAVSNEGFSGNVTEIRTPRLELEPGDFRAETEDRVQIRIGARSLTATGMLAMLQTNQLQLKSNVSGKFVP